MPGHNREDSGLYVLCEHNTQAFLLHFKVYNLEKKKKAILFIKVRGEVHNPIYKLLPEGQTEETLRLPDGASPQGVPVAISSSPL